MALIYADGEVAKQEQQLLNDMIAHFGLNPNLAIIYREWAKNILSLFTQGEALIHLWVTRAPIAACVANKFNMYLSWKAFIMVMVFVCTLMLMLAAQYIKNDH